MRGRTPFLILAIGILLLGIVALNVAAGRFAGGNPEQNEAAESAEEQKGSEPAQTPAAAELEGSGNALVRLPPDTTMGPAEAAKEVVIGWVWTPEVQADPGKVSAAIEAVRKVVPGDVKVRIVNGDAAPDAPLGITVNGRTVRALPENGVLDPAQVTEDVQHALGLEHSH